MVAHRRIRILPFFQFRASPFVVFNTFAYAYARTPNVLAPRHCPASPISCTSHVQTLAWSRYASRTEQTIECS